MGKKSKNKSGLASSTAAKKAKTKKTNPFELRFNREKHSVINKNKFYNKSSSQSVGRPGVARMKGIEKRKATLLQEYRLKNKSNVFVDKRIGEKENLDDEEKMIRRFTMERMKGTSKKSIFNLGDEESLTHAGQSIISDLERHDDPRSDDEDEEDKKLSSKFVDEAHFGGFLTKSDIEFQTGKSNNRKEWIDEMIAESKKKKMEKQKDKEEVQSLTKDLDDKWKQMMGTFKLSGAIYTKREDQVQEKEAEEDSYNVIMRQLTFEPKKAKALDRLKTDEEIVQDEKNKLQKLEDERLKRMKADEEGQDEEAINEESDGEGDDNDDENDDDDEEEENTDEYSDLESDEEEKEKPPAKKKKKIAKKETTNLRTDIPYTFKAPESYEELLEMFESRSPKDKAVVVQRIIVCNNPQFGSDNKSKLEQLFTFLLQHIHDCASDDEPDLDSVQNLMPYLYDLAKFSPQPSGEAIRSVLQEKYEEYSKSPRTYPALETLIFLKLTTLLFPSSDYRHPVVSPALQWMSHILMSARPNSKTALTFGLYIASLMVESVSFSKRFSPELFNFLTGIIFMAVPKDAKTVIPHVPPFKVVGKESTLLCDTFSNPNGISPEKIKLVHDQEEPEVDELFAVSCLNTSLELVSTLADLWKDLPASKEIFTPLLKVLLPKLPLKLLNKKICQTIKQLEDKLQELLSAKRNLQVVKKKEPTKILRLYDPELDDNFDPFQKKRVGSKDKLEMSKLQHKIKREKKGAKKDLRADTAFLSKQKAKEMRERDKERMEKTKSILSGLGGQEGEYRKMQRQKNRKKF